MKKLKEGDIVRCEYSSQCFIGILQRIEDDVVCLSHSIDNLFTRWTYECDTDWKYRRIRKANKEEIKLFNSISHIKYTKSTIFNKIGDKLTSIQTKIENTITKDKWMHFGISMIIAYFSLYYTPIIALPFIFGLLKELSDKYIRGGKFDFYDLFATYLGAVPFVIYIFVHG